MSTQAVPMDDVGNDRKIINISSKRQITIPQKFFTMLGFADEAECAVRGNELILRPVRRVGSGEFAEQILSELINEGFSGAELLQEFKKRQAQMRPAVEAMISDADNAAKGEGEYYTMEDVFGEEDVT